MFLHIYIWSGEETDWVTLTPQNPREEDSSLFDEGICTGFKVPVKQTGKFVSELRELLLKYDIATGFDYKG